MFPKKGKKSKSSFIFRSRFVSRTWGNNERRHSRTRRKTGRILSRFQAHDRSREEARFGDVFEAWVLVLVTAA